jgi:hypothetical protein
MLLIRITDEPRSYKETSTITYEISITRTLLRELYDGVQTSTDKSHIQRPMQTEKTTRSTQTDNEKLWVDHGKDSIYYVRK